MYSGSQRAGLFGVAGLYQSAGLHYPVTDAIDPSTLDPVLFWTAEDDLLSPLQLPIIDINPADASTLDQLTVTRAGNAYQIDSQGLLELVAPNTPRVDQYEGKPRLLVEAGATNLVPDYDWTVNEGIPKTTGQADPTGGTNGVLISDLTTVADEAAYSSVAPITGGNTYSGSFWVKGTSGEVLVCSLKRAGSGNLTFSPSVEIELTGDWQRVPLEYWDSDATNDGGRIVLRGGAANNTADEVTVFGGVVEEGDRMSSWIEPGAVRNRDETVIEGADFPADWDNNKATFFSQTEKRATSGTRYVYQFGDGSALNFVRSTLGSNSHLQVKSDSVQDTNLDAGTMLVGVPQKLATTYSSTDASGCIEGGTIVSQGSGSTAPIGINKVWIGSSRSAPDSSFIDGYIDRLVVWPYTAEELGGATFLQDITGPDSETVLNDMATYAQMPGTPIAAIRNRGTGASYPVQDVGSLQALGFPLVDGEGYAYFPNVNGNYASTGGASLPMNAAWDMELVFCLDTLSPAADKAILSNNLSTYSIRYRSSGVFEIVLGDFTDDVNAWRNISNDGLVVGKNTVRITWDGVDTMSATFNGVSKGTKVLTAPTDMDNIIVGARQNGTREPFDGAIASVKVTGALELDVDFTDPTVEHDATSFVCSTGQTITLQQTGSNSAMLIRHAMLLFDGTDDEYDVTFDAAINGSVVVTNIEGGYTGEMENLGSVLENLNMKGCSYNANGFIQGERNRQSVGQAFFSETLTDSQKQGVANWFARKGGAIKFPPEIGASSAIFRAIRDLVSIDSGLKFEQATSFYRMFRDCNAMRDFPAGVFDNWTLGGEVLQASCFLAAWMNCDLSKQSVENIMVSIAASGMWATTDGTSGGVAIFNPQIDIDHDSGFTITVADTAIVDAWNTLISRGWVPTLNGTTTPPS